MREKINTTRRHIHLNLTKKWFDLILSGEKKQEYRELTDYWQSRFMEMYPVKISGIKYWPTVIFSNGYAKNRRQFEIEIKGFHIGSGNPEWGATPGREYYVIELGDILQYNDIK